MIAGRKKEQKILEKLYKSNKAEFLIMHGRRRVGKTYLVREFFANKKCNFFYATGMRDGLLKEQLKNFVDVVSQTFLDGEPLETPKGWNDTFALLHKQIVKRQGKIVLFLDELPWLASRKSGLLQALDYYWNKYWAKMPQIIVIICGSSESRLIQKTICDKSGLYNCITEQVKVSQFTLLESEEYLKSAGVKLNQKHILKLYSALGGIPYYLRNIEPGLSAEQNIQRIIFDENSPLSDAYDRSFELLFENPDAYQELIELIFKSSGVTRSQLQKRATLSKTSGSLSQRLVNLCSNEFIEETISRGKIRGKQYKLIDPFCLIYLNSAKKNIKNMRRLYYA